jgi:hypothetical protein
MQLSMESLPQVEELVFVTVMLEELLYHQRLHYNRLCVPAAGELLLQVLLELHATPIGRHFGGDKTLVLACCCMWWPGLSSAVTEHPDSSHVPERQSRSPAATWLALSSPHRQQHQPRLP